MANIRVKRKDTYERQMSAVIAKLLTDMEEMEFLRVIHPMEFDRLRKRSIDAAWECFVVGRQKGIEESDRAHTNTAKSRAVNS